MPPLLLAKTAFLPVDPSSPHEHAHVEGHASARTQRYASDLARWLLAEFHGRCLATALSGPAFAGSLRGGAGGRVGRARALLRAHPGQCIGRRGAGTAGLRHRRSLRRRTRRGHVAGAPGQPALVAELPRLPVAGGDGGERLVDDGRRGAPCSSSCPRPGSGSEASPAPSVEAAAEASADLDALDATDQGVGESRSDSPKLSARERATRRGGSVPSAR